jgi:hypothetical protein
MANLTNVLRPEIVHPSVLTQASATAPAHPLCRRSISARCIPSISRNGPRAIRCPPPPARRRPAAATRTGGGCTTAAKRRVPSTAARRDDLVSRVRNRGVLSDRARIGVLPRRRHPYSARGRKIFLLLRLRLRLLTLMAARILDHSPWCRRARGAGDRRSVGRGLAGTSCFDATVATVFDDPVLTRASRAQEN